MTHDDRNLVIGHLQLINESGIKSNLAARHAKCIYLLGTNQVDFPLPPFGPIKGVRRIDVAFAKADRKRNESFGDAPQPYDRRIIIGRQCALRLILCFELIVLLRRASFHADCRLKTHEVGFVGCRYAVMRGVSTILPDGGR